MKLTPIQFRKMINYSMAGFVAFEVMIVVAYLACIFFAGRSPMLINMDGLRNLPSGLEAILIFLIGGVALDLGITHQTDFPHPSRKLSFFLAGLLLYAGFDEVFKLHQGSNSFLPIGGTYHWIAIYSSLLCLLPILFLQDFKACWHSYRQEMLIGVTGLSVFVLGGFGGELFKCYLLEPLLANSSSLQSNLFLSLFIEKFRGAVEEFGELFGETMVFYAALRFIVLRLEEKQNRLSTVSSPKIV